MHARVVVFTALMASGHILAPARLDAKESSGTPAARASFTKGDAAAKAGQLADAIAAFRKAIELDPDFVEAHQRFIETTQRDEAPSSRTPQVVRLKRLYEGWAKQHPTRAVYKWALGFLEHEPKKADVFFSEALKIDPAFARAHFSLARNADLRGDWAAERRHLNAAVENNPDNPQYLMRYAQAHKRSDPPRFRELAQRVVEKFPDTPSAAEALYRLAAESSNPERRAYLERVRASYPPDKFPYGWSALSMLYGELLEPSEALALSKQMVTWLPTNKTWAGRVAHHEAMARAQTLVREGKFAEALDVIQKTSRPSGAHGTTWVLMKAEAAAGSGQVEQAYATLVESVAATPDGRLQDALAKYATDLRKTPQQVNADVWRIRDAAAVPAPPFQLTNARDGKPVQLSDYRGCVVLLAFWFPG